MRVHIAIALASILASAAAPAVAQNQVASTQNQATASDQKPAVSKPKKAAKQAGDKICKRLSQGKVCMTEAQWKAYQEIM